MPERDPYFGKIWHSFRRETAVLLAALAFLVIIQYVYLLYRYFVEPSAIEGGATAAAILCAGTAMLLGSWWFALATWRSAASLRPMWWTVGLSLTGIVVPITLLYLVLPA